MQDVVDIPAHGRQKETCWDENSRFFLRITIHGLVAFLLGLILLQIVLYSVFYHRISDKTPIGITPFASAIPDNDTLVPCVFPRILTDEGGGSLCVFGGSYCPPGYSCSIVSDQDTQVQTMVCLNNGMKCGDLHYCTSYIESLSATDSIIPGKLADVGVAGSYYLGGVILMCIALVLLVSMWLAFNIWAFMINAESDAEAPETLKNMYKVYLNYVPETIPPGIQVLINMAILFPLLLLIFISGVVFLSGASPSLNSLVEVSSANCFVDHWLYLFSATMLGWITGFFVTQLICVIALFALLSLYNISPLFKIWDTRVFLTIIILVSIIVACGIAIELVDTIISATS